MMKDLAQKNHMPQTAHYRIEENVPYAVLSRTNLVTANRFKQLIQMSQTGIYSSKCH